MLAPFLSRKTYLLALWGLIPLILIALSQPVMARNWQEKPADTSDISAVLDTPNPLVTGTVSHYAVGMPRLVWHTPSVCDVIPTRIEDTTAAADPELITRIFYTGGMKRVIFSENPSRPPETCNPYKIYSNLIADENYTYWADSTGLVRQSMEANSFDSPQTISTDVKSTHNSNKVLLAQSDTHIYALVYISPISSRLLRINKTTFTADPTFAILGYANQLKADNDYAYWSYSGNLWQMEYVPGTGWQADNIATGVTSFGTTSFYVFIAQGNTIVRYNKGTGQLGPTIYTSASANVPSIYQLTADSFNVFFLERRDNVACPDCVLTYTQVLFRTGVSGGTAVPLYTKVSPPVQLNVTNLQQGNEYLYWQEDAGINSLPKNAADLPQTNMSIARLEVTQGVQDTSNNVPLIGGRRTFVRVYGLAQGQDVFDVTALLYRVNPTTLEPIGDPLAPMNSNGQTHNMVMPLLAPSLIDNSFNFELPLSWVQTGVPLRLKAVINPYNTPLESNPNDNTAFSKTFTPVASSRLEVEFYAFIYTDSLSKTFQSPRHIEDIEQTFSYIRRTYPLASAPAGYDTPGFRPNVHWVMFGQLERLLRQTDPYCADFDANEMNSCAATYVLDMLRGWQARDEDADGTAYIYYGWMSDYSGFGRGLGGDGAAAGPTGSGTFGWDFDGAYTDWYTAHELAHAIGRLHPSKGNDCGHSDDDDDYPYLDTAIGPYDGKGESGIVWGFDSGDAWLGLPRQPLPSSIWRDFMGYCSNQWLSDYTYKGLYADIPDWVNGVRPANKTAVAIPDALVIYGSLFPDTEVAKLTFIQRTNVNNPPPLVNGDFAIRLLNSQNQVLASHSFTPDVPEDNALLHIGQAVPFMAGTAKVQVVHLPSGKVWGEASVSSNAPVVSGVNVVAATNPVTGTVMVNWQATDADKDVLTADIFYSQDGGASFLPYLLGVSGVNSTAVDTNFLGGGSTIFRVAVSDGVNLGHANSAPFTVANKKPTPAIHNPGDGAVVSWGQLINLIGEARDLQDGSVDPANLVWSNQYGTLGSGDVLPVTDLPTGLNQITLTATNSKGVTASTSITIYVGDNLSTPTAELQIGPSPLSWHVAPGEEALQSAEVDLVNIGVGNLTWTASENADWLTLSSYAGGSPTKVTFTANPQGLTADAFYTTEVTFAYVDGEGQAQAVRVPLSLLVGDVRNNPPQPFQTVRTYLPLVLR